MLREATANELPWPGKQWVAGNVLGETSDSLGDCLFLARLASAFVQIPHMILRRSMHRRGGLADELHIKVVLVNHVTRSVIANHVRRCAAIPHLRQGDPQVGREANREHVHMREGVEGLGVHDVGIGKHAVGANLVIGGNVRLALLLRGLLQHGIQIAHTEQPTDLLVLDTIAKLHPGVDGHVQVGLAKTTADVDEATTGAKVGVKLHQVDHLLHRTAGQLSVDGPTCSIATKAACASVHQGVYLLNGGYDGDDGGRRRPFVGGCI